MWHNFLSVLWAINNFFKDYFPIAPGQIEHDQRVFIARASSKMNPELVSVNVPRSTFQSTCLARGAKILSTFAFILTGEIHDSKILNFRHHTCLCCYSHTNFI